MVKTIVRKRHPYWPWLIDCDCKELGLECGCNGDPDIHERMRADGVDVMRFDDEVSATKPYQTGVEGQYTRNILDNYCSDKGCSIIHAGDIRTGPNYEAS